MNKKNPADIRIIFIGLLSVAFACSLLTGSAGQPKAPGSGSSDSAPETTYIGDYISLRGYFYAVLQVLDPAPASEISAPRSGWREVAVEIVAGNQNGELFQLGSDFALDDGTNTQYSIDPMNAGAGIIFEGGVLDRGDRARGWMVFSIPETSKPLRLTFRLTNPVAGWDTFHLGLTPPPDGYTPLHTDTSRKPPSRAAFGKAAEKNGYSLKALEVTDPVDSIPLITYSKPLNSRAVGVKIEIRNTSDSILLIRDISLSDKDGYVYGLTISEFTQSQGQLTVNPGAVISDWMYFILPADASLDVVRLICNNLSNPMEDVILRTGLS